MPPAIRQYSFSVLLDPDSDQRPGHRDYVGTVAELPSLSYIGPTEKIAMDGIRMLTEDVLRELERNGEHVPQPNMVPASPLELKVHEYLRQRVRREYADVQIMGEDADEDELSIMRKAEEILDSNENLPEERQPYAGETREEIAEMLNFLSQFEEM